MMFPKHSIDYEVNLECLHEIEESIPMTLHERECLRAWAKSGHPVDSNPWTYCDSTGIQLNYLLAFRIRFGFPSRIWEYWDCEYSLSDDGSFHFSSEF